MSIGRWRAVADLTVAAAFWGFGFIASIWALRILSAYEITFLRFLLAGVVGLPFLIRRAARADLKTNFLFSFWPSVLLCTTLLFQTMGLNYTTPTKSGFITTLYVVMVPVLDSVFSRRWISWRLWSFIFLAFLGTAFILNVGFSAVNFGDVLTLICAVFAAVQIYWVGVISPRIRTPFAFNVSQCLWAVLLTLPFCLWGDGGLTLWSKLQSVGSWPVESTVGLVSLALGSTVLAFFLQVRGQAGVSPTVGSILCLLESPFAMLFALLALGHMPGGLELIGAGLIFTAAIGASVGEARG